MLERPLYAFDINLHGFELHIVKGPLYSFENVLCSFDLQKLIFKGPCIAQIALCSFIKTPYMAFEPMSHLRHFAGPSMAGAYIACLLLFCYLLCLSISLSLCVSVCLSVCLSLLKNTPHE